MFDDYLAHRESVLLGDHTGILPLLVPGPIAVTQSISAAVTVAVHSACARILPVTSGPSLRKRNNNI